MDEEPDAVRMLKIYDELAAISDKLASLEGRNDEGANSLRRKLQEERRRLEGRLSGL